MRPTVDKLERGRQLSANEKEIPRFSKICVLAVYVGCDSAGTTILVESCVGVHQAYDRLAERDACLSDWSSIYAVWLL